jgi:hypothetical protein
VGAILASAVPDELHTVLELYCDRTYSVSADQFVSIIRSVNSRLSSVLYQVTYLLPIAAAQYTVTQLMMVDVGDDDDDRGPELIATLVVDKGWGWPPT